jgi:Bacterial Ig-like domain (group 3)
VVVVLVVITVVVISTAGQVRSASGPYRRAVDRSYAAMAGPLGRSSAVTGAQLGTALAQAPSLDRVSLFERLDQVVTDAEQLSARFATITPPDPHNGAGERCAAAIDARSVQAREVRDATEGVLGGRAGATVLPQAAAVKRLTAAGAALEAADAAWRSCRSALLAAPGSARLAPSVWVTDPSAWSATAVTALVEAMASSPSLAVHRELTINAGALSTDPAAVQIRSSGGVVLPPTRKVSVHVVVANDGNVVERDVKVSATFAAVAPAGHRPEAAVTSSSRPMGVLGAGHSAAMSVPATPVVPGTGYTITVNLTSAASTAVAATVSLPVAVAAQASATELLSSGTPSRVGHAVTYTALVSALGGSVTPTGGVVFEDGGVAVPGCAAVRVTSGRATCTVAYHVAGVHDMTATYSGAESLAGSTSALVTQIVKGTKTSPSSTTTAPR